MLCTYIMRQILLWHFACYGILLALAFSYEYIEDEFANIVLDVIK